MPNFPVLPSRLLRMQGRIASLHRELTSLGAVQAARPVPKPTDAGRSVSIWSEFNSATISLLEAELD